METKPLTVDVPREFHRRMAAIIDAVQVGVWEEGVHDLLGYATDYAFGQQRGLQTLVLRANTGPLMCGCIGIPSWATALPIDSWWTRASRTR